MTRIVICLIVAALAIGCKKKDTKQVVTTIDPQTKQNFSFQPGTYWIYKDSVSGKEDSFYVSQNATTTGADGIEQNEALITIHNDTSVGTCRLILRQSGIRFALARPRVGFNIIPLGNYFSLNFITFPSGGTTYDSVYKVHIEGAYYLRHNVGLVKIAAKKDAFYKVWELQRYHITK